MDRLQVKAAERRSAVMRIKWKEWVEGQAALAMGKVLDGERDRD